MPPAARRLGAHLPLGLGMVKAVDRANEIGANAIQVFADNPTAWRRRLQPPKELPAFRQRLEELAIAPVAIHASYLVNLAGPDEHFHAASIEVLASELRVAPGFRARFVNVHVGSHRGAGVEAGGGFGLGVDVTELAAIAEAAAAKGIADARLGFCLDAAHAWGAGIDLAHPEAIDAWLEDFDARIGLDRLVMVHLNDSKSERGSRLDRHEHLGAGQIGPLGLGHLLRHPRLDHAAFYLETPGMDEGYDAINMTRARDLLADRPLGDLPPEAMDLRGSRARTAPPEDADA